MIYPEEKWRKDRGKRAEFPPKRPRLRVATGHGEENGAGERIRTPDQLITNQLLYQLSYAGSDAQRALF